MSESGVIFLSVSDHVHENGIDYLLHRLPHLHCRSSAISVRSHRLECRHDHVDEVVDGGLPGSRGGNHQRVPGAIVADQPVDEAGRECFFTAIAVGVGPGLWGRSRWLECCHDHVDEVVDGVLPGLRGGNHQGVPGAIAADQPVDQAGRDGFFAAIAVGIGQTRKLGHGGGRRSVGPTRG